eukprot:12521842-Ditylum_brightwellii.AAC.1
MQKAARGNGDIRKDAKVTDQGSELGRNVEVKKLLTKYGYDIRPTGPDASHQNSPQERPHETIGMQLDQC